MSSSNPRSDVIDLTGDDSPRLSQQAVPSFSAASSSSSAFIPKNNTNTAFLTNRLHQPPPSTSSQSNLNQQPYSIVPRDKHSTSKTKLVDPSAFIPIHQQQHQRNPLIASNNSFSQLPTQRQPGNGQPKPIPFTTASQLAARAESQLSYYNHQPINRFPIPPASSYLTSSSPTRYPYQPPSIPQQSASTSSTRLEGDPLADEPEPSEWSNSGGKTDIATTTKSLRDLVFETVDLDELDLEKANIEGMKCTLLPHQVIGVGWAVNREKGPNKGGLLADDMGLGKTVQMIGLIVQNHPSNKEATIRRIVTPKQTKSKSKAKAKSKVTEEDEEEPESVKTKIKSNVTLILAPLAVLKQWSDEIKNKTEGLKVLIHHDKTKVKVATEFLKYDVVITSYTTAAAEWKNTKEGKESLKKREANKRGKKDKDHEQDQTEGEKKSNEKVNDFNDSIDELWKDDSEDEVVVRKKATAKSKKPSLTPLFDADWLRIIADEAQNIKNRDTNGAQACFLLSKKAVSRWCLTGTPIQNSAMELFSLIHFLRMPPFNEFKHFKEKIADPLNSSNATRSFHGMKRLRFVLETFMLRRTKTAELNGKPILTLPKRNVEVLTLEFDDPSEREFYESLEALIRGNIEKASEKSENGKINHIMVLTGLMRLRQACNHPSLCSKLILEDIAAMKAEETAAEKSTPSDDSKITDIKDQTSGTADDSADELADLFSKVTVEKKCASCQEILNDEIPKDQFLCRPCNKVEKKIMEKGIDWFNPERSSTKIRAIMKILNDIKNKGEGEKTIVFSQFTSFLNLLEPFLRAEKLKFVRYDGTMKNQDRELVLEKIRSSTTTNIILISFKAGSTGLTLTCANHVILCDLWWNPQLEEQAFDRAHRFGQQKDVQIYKLSLVKTVEERILALQEKKRALSNAALEGTKVKKSKNEKADMRFLMGMFGAEI